MIQILTGVPGSGKSYFAVKEILDLLDDNSLVVHNIHGLNDPRAVQLDFSKMPLDADSLFAYFDQLRQEKGLLPENIIHVYIDEAQRYYPYEYKDPKGVYFFDFHRHHGLHITLISQDIKKLSPKITTLSEYEIRAVKPIFSFTPGFSYNLLSSGEAFGKRRLPKKPEVFAAYTSFTAGTKKTKKSKLVYVVPAMVVLAILAYISFQMSFANTFEELSEAHNEAKKSKHVQKVSTYNQPSIVEGNLGQSTQNENIKSEYLGPVVLDYSTIKDSVKIEESGFEVWVPVKDFVSRFTPEIYGYGYIHFPKKKFIQMNSANSEFIYPVKNAILVKSFIKNETPPARSNLVASATDSGIVYPIEFENMNSGPDSKGYSRKDYEMIYRRQRGLSDPQPPAPIPPVLPDPAQVKIPTP